MLYEAKQGSKAYDYIKGVLEAEEKEYQAYMKRVDEAVGFKFEKWQGYQPNRSLLREYDITAIWVPTAQYEKLDKKLWREVGTQLFDDGRYVGIAPNKRCKQGKAIAAVLASYKAVANHFGILDELGIGGPKGCPFSITQLLRCNDRYFAFFDDSIRAEKKNPDFKEITIGEYEDLVNDDKEG
ncbi:MAG: hypothetical protein JTJ26_03935 [Prevotella sp.]|nr:hypothetical protein [Prevotella sp.]